MIQEHLGDFGGHVLEIQVIAEAAARLEDYILPEQHRDTELLAEAEPANGHPVGNGVALANGNLSM